MGLRAKAAALLDRAAQYVHKDRAAGAEYWLKYGGAKVMRRSPNAPFDILARNINANVAICVRALSDAIGSLPLQIVSTEETDGADSSYVDTDHPANALLKHPNPTMTLRKIVRHMVMSYLGDGNAICTIERQTGPNATLELWPRDPRNVVAERQGVRVGAYRIEGLPDGPLRYPASRVLHICDVTVEDPLWGKPRHESVRVEIEMDYKVNQFNRAWFEHGGALGLMFTPDVKLTPEQHEQLLEQLKADTEGVDNYFGTFINRYPGKIENPGLKHKDIAFLELLKHIREKIFGVFGLPPFRGGVMEYANYANAVAQDKDFWNNTVMPITSTLADDINSQLIWPYFGEDIMLKFYFGGVPALQGDPKERADVHCAYVREGILTKNEVREELGREELDEPAAPPPTPPDDDEDEAKSPADKGDDEDKPTAKPPKKEEQSMGLVILKELRRQRRCIVSSMREFSVNGAFMSRFCFPEKDVQALLPHERTNRGLHVAVLPPARALLYDRVVELHKGSELPGLPDSTDGPTSAALGLLKRTLNDFNTETRQLVTNALSDCDTYGWSLDTLTKNVVRHFSPERAGRLAHDIVSLVWRKATTINYEHEAVESQALIDSKTRKEAAA